jgi:hypothetical protein
MVEVLNKEIRAILEDHRKRVCIGMEPIVR